MSRLTSRLATFAAIALRLPGHGFRKPPAEPRRILVLHHLLLGDSLMMTPLLAKLRQRYPAAQICMAGGKGLAPLFAGRPFGVDYLPYHPGDLTSCLRLIRSGPYDLALIPADNRYSLLAYAMGARWIKAFSGDTPAYKSWLVDQFLDYPQKPMHWADINTLFVDGPYPEPFNPELWPTPPGQAPAIDRPYIVFHVGASTVLKQWPAENWRALAQRYRQRGYRIVWSGGPGEEPCVERIGPLAEDLNCAGRLNLAELWHLLKGAQALVCPDTGVAHLGRITNTPTVCLFGPGNPGVFGNCRFWQQDNYLPVQVAVDCRDQHRMFKREIPWLTRCNRSSRECANPVCMNNIDVVQVARCMERLLESEQPLDKGTD